VVGTAGIDEDPDLAAAWREGLLEALREDCAHLLSIIENHDFGQGVIAIDDQQADATLRACSAIRLKIQQTFLQDIPSEALETGEIDFYALKPDTQKVFACYVFLASWQEMLLAEMYPHIAEEISFDEGDVPGDEEA